MSIQINPLGDTSRHQTVLPVTKNSTSKQELTYILMIFASFQGTWSIQLFPIESKLLPTVLRKLPEKIASQYGQWIINNLVFYARELMKFVFHKSMHQNICHEQWGNTCVC